MFQAASELRNKNSNPIVPLPFVQPLPPPPSSSSSSSLPSVDPRAMQSTYSLFPRPREEEERGEMMRRSGSTSQMFFSSMQNDSTSFFGIWQPPSVVHPVASAMPVVYDPPAVDVDLQDQTVDSCMVYVRDILETQREREREQKIPDSFLSLQPEISERHRSALVEWIAKTCAEAHLLNETFFLAIKIVDKIFSTVVVSSAKIQLVGCAALMIASKFEEEYGIRLADLSTACARRYTEADMMKMEQSILNVLNFEILFVTPLHFLRRFSRAAGNDQKAHGLAKFFAELSAADHLLSPFPPSLIAAASVYLSRLYTLSALSIPFPEDACVLSSRALRTKETSRQRGKRDQDRPLYSHYYHQQQQHKEEDEENGDRKRINDHDDDEREGEGENENDDRIPHRIWTQTLREYCGFDSSDLSSTVARINLLFSINRPTESHCSFISKKYAQRKLLSVSTITPLPTFLFRFRF